MQQTILLLRYCSLLTLCWIIWPLSNLHADTYPGLPTRGQNPLLQSYFIPAQPQPTSEPWSLVHSLYITNTYQEDQSSTEQLLIDVENYRYDLQINFRQQAWLFNANLSLISNKAGFLDQTIDSWHDFFGLPEGGREDDKTDQIQFFYQKDGVTIIDSQQSSSGLADIQLAAGYQLSATSQLWAALELAAGADSEFISNDATDAALWYSGWFEHSDRFSSHGLVGLAFPADEGLFEGSLHDQFLFAQYGIIYRLHPSYQIMLQADYHSEIVNDSRLDGLEDSLQMQFALGLPRLIDGYQLDLFFSEDIVPGHAPDITFSLRIYPRID